MKAGFYTIMAAQFFSSLADNALLIAAIALLRELEEPAWMTPSLKMSFVVSYVLLAPLVGAFADSMPKGKVMLITNGIKVVGCTLMLFSAHPLVAYAVVGFGAAAYSPAKYGILTELLPPQQLVVANGWIEGTTVGSIILGVLVGGALISPKIAASLLGFDLPLIASLQTDRRHPRERFRAFAAELGRMPQSVCVWVGPEGDYTPAELSAIKGDGALPISLGPLILRSETAAIYCLSVLNYELQAPLNPASD